MKNKTVIPVLIAMFFLITIGSSTGEACSTFLLKDSKRLVVGKNFDFICDLGTVTVNKRGVIKKALAMPPETPAQWVSKYGSITFNQVAREYPMGGMNEKGLVIEVMWLDITKFPEPDGRPGISELQWLQYQLDNHTRVEEVIKSDKDIRISKTSSRIHFLAADAQGNAATIEFIDGKMVFRTGKTLPYDVLTNHTYNQSLEYLRTHKGFGGTKPVTNTKKSLDRFVCAVDKVKTYKKTASKKAVSPVKYAFDTLSYVDQSDYTVWSIVHDITNREIHFKTVREKKIKTFRLKDFDFDCKTPVKVLDMNNALKGSVAGKFTDYDPKSHRKMIFSVFRIYRTKNFMTKIPNAALEFLAGYPASLMCKEK